MFTDQFKHEINSYLKSQSERLLSAQKAVAETTYRQRSGQLMHALSSQATVSEMTVTVPYPLHIRFLDMKKSSRGANRRRKKRYAPIYNKYVYGYLKSDVWRMLMAGIPKQMVKTIESTFTAVK